MSPSRRGLVVFLILFYFPCCLSVVRYSSRSPRQQVVIQLKELEGALRLFELDTERVPTTAEGLQALLAVPPGLISWRGPYLSKTAIPLDPWGRPYRYRQLDVDRFEIASFGRDGLVGGAGEDADVVASQGSLSGR